MKSRSGTQLARWLLLGVTLMIVYASLYPFQFSEPVPGESLPALLGRLSWARTTASDVAVNVLLYLPLGACLGWLFASRLGGPLALAAATLAGVLLSTSIEVTQLFEPHRVASLGDVSYNGLGTLLGALLALGLRAARHDFHRRGIARPLGEPIASTLVLLWAGFRLAPFAATLDLNEWRASFHPLTAGGWFAPLETFGFLVPWLVVGECLRTIMRPRDPLVALAAVILMVEAGLVLVVGRRLLPAEVVAVVLVLALVAPLSRLDGRQRAALLVAGLVLVVIAQGLAPFDFRVEHEAFGLVPFRHALTRYRATNLVDMFDKLFLYGALVWLLPRAGLRRLHATLATCGLVLVVALLQAWLPGKAAEITDPLLVLVAGGLIAMFDADPRRQRDMHWRR